jgi:hypothetical protein
VSAVTQAMRKTTVAKSRLLVAHRDCRKLPGALSEPTLGVPQTGTACQKLPGTARFCPVRRGLRRPGLFGCLS